MLNDGLLVPGSTITGVGAGLVFHAKFEVYLTTGNTRVQEFADVTVESASTGNPRSTMVPASGTLGQQYGGTGVNFNTATDGQLLIGNTGADADLATITEGDGVTITNGAGTITISSKVYNGTSTINFNTATDGQILIGDTGSDAVLGNITLGSKGGLTITNGAGTISVEANVNQGSTSGFYAVYWDTKTKSFWYT
jgi:hypothetical protein